MQNNTFSKYMSNVRLNSGVISPLMVEGMRILYIQGWKIKELAKHYEIEKEKVVRLLENDGVL